MKYTELTPFYYKIFSLQELAQYFHEPFASIKTQLSRWVKEKRLIRLKKNCYMFPSPLQAKEEEIAESLVNPSYTSLEMVLSWEGIIPETVVHHTGITSRKPKTISTPFGTFSYQHLPPHLFFGVDRRSDGAFVATPEKALLDYLYLNSWKFKPDFKCWQAERFDELDTLDWKKMKEWAPKFGMKKLVKLVESLEKYYQSDAYQDHR